MNKFLSFLGLTRKSGHLVAGGNIAEAALKKGQLSLIILAKDASEGTKKKFHSMAAYRGVEIIEASEVFELGSAIGKGQISVIGITDQKMSEKLKELCSEM